MLFAEVSPMHHLSASTIFDLPQPLGPTMPVSPFSIRKIVFSAKDLNPLSWTFLNCIYRSISFFREFFLNFYSLMVYQTFYYLLLK